MEKKGYKVWDWIAALIVIVCINLSWISKTYYDRFIPYASIPTFIMLAILFFNHIDWVKALKNKDQELMLIIAGAVIACINIVLSDSNWGAIITIVNLFLILYLANKVHLDEKIIYTVGAVCLLILLSWVGKGDRGYNTNHASLILFSLASFGLTSLTFLSQKFEKEKLGRIITFISIIVVIMPMIFNLKARCVLIGILMFLVLNYAVPPKVWNSKKMYQWYIILLLSVSIIFPIGYVWLWKNQINISYQFLGKSFFSGRHVVWNQFLGAFYKEPFTGIGSNFIKKFPDALYTEVHNGLLDILVVYGIINFLIIAYLLYKRLMEIRIIACTSIAEKQSLCFIIAILLISIFENYFILTPYNQIWFFLFLLINKKVKEKT